MANHGLNSAALDTLVTTIEQDIAERQYDGAVVLVARHGEIALHRAIGHSDLDAGRRASTDDVFHLMSMVSPVATKTLLVYSPLLPVPFREMLVERGFRQAELVEPFEPLDAAEALAAWVEAHPEWWSSLTAAR